MTQCLNFKRGDILPIMSILDNLREFVESIKTKITNLTFQENDVRKAYFENLYSVLNEFYMGKVFFEVSKEIKNSNIKFTPVIYHLRTHIMRIYEIADHPLLSNSYHNELNRKVFSDTFTNFESTIDMCFSQIISNNSLDKIVEEINAKIFKICKEGLEQKEKLLEHFRKSTFIPLIRKFKFLAKYRTDCYGATYQEDVEFIEFNTKLRNCILHSAGFYKGKNYEYEFGGIKFIFKNQEFLEMQGDNVVVFVEINKRFTEIIERILSCLSDIDFIQYPDDGF